MFLRKLKEWGMLAIKYLPGDKMSTDLLRNNLPGHVFDKHIEFFVTDETISDTNVYQVRESVRIMLRNEVCESPISKCDGPMWDKHECGRLLPVGDTDRGNMGLLCGRKKMEVTTAYNSKSDGSIMKMKSSR
jgi:hypothetical protein